MIGALSVASREVGHFSNDSLALVGAIGNQVAVAINNARLYELIQNQAERRVARDEAGGDEHEGVRP